MANDITGTPRKVTLDGITFDVMADTNISEMGSRFENEPVPTSGRTIKKMTRRSQGAESVTLACNGDERTVLKELDERTENLRPSLTGKGFLEEIEDMLGVRNPYYENAMSFSVDTDEYGIDEISGIIMKKLDELKIQKGVN